MKTQLTLTIIQQGDRVLLGRKKRGLGADYYNGFGGKVERGETVSAAAAREVQEEIGVTVTDSEQCGLLAIVYHDRNEVAVGLSQTFADRVPVLEMHVFRAKQFTGHPRASDEMDPQYFNTSAIPYDQMWPDDRYWLPLLLSNQYFQGQLEFKNQETLLAHTINTIASHAAPWHTVDIEQP